MISSMHKVRKTANRLIALFTVRLFGLAVNLLARLSFDDVPDMQPQRLLQYVIAQKVLRINGGTRKMVHWSSRYGPLGKITAGRNTHLAANLGCYVQAINGIVAGDDIIVGPNTCIISANHDPAAPEGHLADIPVRIGNSVWIGCNCVILPGVRIGDKAVIGAGSVVGKDIPAGAVAWGNPCEVRKWQ